METLEEKSLATATLQPKLWLRYVDDTFVIWPHGQEALDEFHTHLNSQNEDIQFTMEAESGGKLLFLDTSEKRWIQSDHQSVQEADPHKKIYSLLPSPPKGLQIAQQRYMCMECPAFACKSACSFLDTVIPFLHVQEIATAFSGKFENPYIATYDVCWMIVCVNVA